MEFGGIRILFKEFGSFRVNVVFEAFRGQLRKCFSNFTIPFFGILPHTLQRACPLQRPLDHTRHNPTGRPGGREAGGREAGRLGGREAVSLACIVHYVLLAELEVIGN